MEAVEKLVASMRKAEPEEREALKAELVALASGPDAVLAREAIENCKRGELLEVQWELEEVLEVTAPKKVEKKVEAPKKEEPKEDPNRPLTAKDLVLVYDDPRGIMLHKAKVGERWFLTQVNPRTGQPQTMELMPQEVAQVKAQLEGSPYWVIGSGASSAPAPAPAPTRPHPRR